jgi:hypothetical protein
VPDIGGDVVVVVAVAVVVVVDSSPAIAATPPIKLEDVATEASGSSKTSLILASKNEKQLQRHE